MSNIKILLICCLFCMIFICNSAYARRESSRGKTCFNNIRVIQGAVEMYNTGTGIMMEKLNIEDLIKGHYLKEKPVKPDTSCEYKNFGNLSDDGFVFCTYHGDIDRILICKYNDDFGIEQFDKVPQNATIEEYKKSKEGILKTREEQRKKEANKGKTKSIIFSVEILLAIILFIISIVSSLKKHK